MRPFSEKDSFIRFKELGTAHYTVQKCADENLADYQRREKLGYVNSQT